ncbi:MAG TPA: 4-hydroxythreonine-4-phosphate dehydrogenase PdxA [Thermoanaerobaculia bacterium]|nr:4-hydroxythreonine-4-phosphate dehydrogenase PdxA [Thermoanaerobaculia bacterium]
MAAPLPVLALTQGDPAGIGPEILLKLAAGLPPEGGRCVPLLVAERAALEAVRDAVPANAWERLVFLDAAAGPDDLDEVPPGAAPVLDPVGRPRTVNPGRSGPDDAWGALAALDAGIDLASRGVAAALVTGPVSKESIATHALPGFTGHTDYLAEKAGLSRYGRDYLMAFLAPDLRVALLSTHLPLRDALDRVTEAALVEALACLDRHLPDVSGRRPRIAVAGLNPHAGEGGLLGSEDAAVVAPAVAAARSRGIDARGPESADSLFARARRGEFDWVLALYHDQGLIAVKTAAFGDATNWTVGLPYLRTSVDHGTAFALAGRGEADAEPLERVVETTLGLLAGRAV